MNAGVPAANRGGLILLTLGAVLGLSVWPESAPARKRQLSAQEAIRQADRLYRADQLLSAEPLYRQGLNASDHADRRRCYDQLLAIYVRVGRQDQAIQTGREYLKWLLKTRDRMRAREVKLDLGRWYYNLGHYATAEEPYLRDARAEFKDAPWRPAHRLTALTYLALAAEKQGERARAGRAWREVEAFARSLLEGRRRARDPALRIECVRRLADSYRFQGRPGEAIPRLEQILPIFARLRPPDPLGQRDTLRQLAEHLKHLKMAKSNVEAEKRLKEALELHKEHAAGDRLTRAELDDQLGDVLEQQGRPEEARRKRDQAAQGYMDVLKNPGAGRPEGSGEVTAFWKLQQHYQRDRQYQLALDLTQDRSIKWAGDLLDPRLAAEEGRLQGELGKYLLSEKRLSVAVDKLEKQDPPNLLELPVALLNLGVAKLATGDLAGAKKRGLHCLDLYSKYGLPDDLVLVEAYDLVGKGAFLGGEYAEAIAHYRAGVDHCVRLGSAADRRRCNLLLNIALLHKAQGDLDRALTFCQEARALYQDLGARDALVDAALDAASATLLVVQERPQLDAANKLAGRILKFCRQQGIRRGSLVLTARHCQALFHLRDKKFSAAEAAWHEVDKLHGAQSPLRPRTLNYLGLTCECRKRWDDAAKLYQEARRLQEKNPRSLPVTHFTTLWRLANDADRRGRRAEARRLLEQAITVVERARLQTYGGAQQRAGFFAQFAPAFEQLVAWCVRDGDMAGAVAAAARGRSRTLQDQLMQANVNPREGLHGPKADQWLRQEEELRRRIAALRASALLFAAAGGESGKLRKLLTDLDAAQQEYTDVYREILNASPVYRSLGGQEFTAAKLKGLRDSVLGPRKLLLVYHVGRAQSYLLLLGDRSRRPEAFALTVPADLARRVAPPAPLPQGKALAKTRGMFLKRDRKQPALPPPARKRPRGVPLGQAVLRALVENYLEEITDPGFRPTRGMHLEAQNPARPLDPQRPELLADVLLPPAARQRIKALAPENLIVVPDGALHKLPFEALLLRSDPRPSYVLDELPPLAYAPSVASLTLLAERRPASRRLRSLLTLADPAYPQAVKRGEQRRGAQPMAWGQFLPLPNTWKESKRIQRFFAKDEILALRGTAAAKKELKKALPGRQVVHIAAHGIADERFGNQFGALVLTPAPPENDGFLALHEIYTLKLDSCELAVLSACVTNVGPQLPLEAGVTLAGGFLAAGAHRVVASHWGVDDESTAELMATFFQKVTADAKAGRPVAYARALQQARLKVRARTDWSSPYFWAPFVLVGPAD
jgi:CHAT domain-containing protein/tetratricopeptide (TPR) repeat protein